MVRLATNGFFRFYRKCFGMKVERRFHRCTDIKYPLCLIKMQIPFDPFWPFLIGCMVSADYWLTDYPELRRTTQPSTTGSPLGKPGFCIFCSTAEVHNLSIKILIVFGDWLILTFKVKLNLKVKIYPILSLSMWQVTTDLKFQIWTKNIS